MKKHLTILLVIVIIIFGFIQIKNYLILKDGFIFNQSNIVSTTLPSDKSGKNKYDYEISKNLVDNISKVLSNTKKESIKDIKYNPINSYTGIDIYLDGNKQFDKDDFSLTFKRKITILNQKNNIVHVKLEVNRIENESMRNIITKYYSINSKNLFSYINHLYN